MQILELTQIFKKKEKKEKSRKTVGKNSYKVSRPSEIVSFIKLSPQNSMIGAIIPTLIIKNLNNFSIHYN